MINFFKKKESAAPLNQNFEHVKQLIIEILGVDAEEVDFTTTTRFEDIGFDSLQFINLLLSLEDIVELDLETIAAEIDPASIQTIGDVVRLLDALENNEMN